MTVTIFDIDLRPSWLAMGFSRLSLKHTIQRKLTLQAKEEFKILKTKVRANTNVVVHKMMRRQSTFKPKKKTILTCQFLTSTRM